MKIPCALASAIRSLKSRAWSVIPVTATEKRRTSQCPRAVRRHREGFCAQISFLNRDTSYKHLHRSPNFETNRIAIPANIGWPSADADVEGATDAFEVSPKAAERKIAAADEQSVELFAYEVNAFGMKHTFVERYGNQPKLLTHSLGTALY